MATPATTNVLDGLLKEAHRLDEAEFVDKYPHPLLIVEGESGIIEPRSSAGDSTLRTGDDQEIEEQACAVIDRPDSSAFAFLSIGRSSQNHLVIDHRRVSKIHLALHKDKERFLVMDVGSSNGTVLNGRPLSPRVQHPLSDNDTLVLADKALLRFLLPASAYRWLRRRTERR